MADETPRKPAALDGEAAGGPAPGSGGSGTLLYGATVGYALGSIYDFLTLGAPLWILDASEALFRVILPLMPLVAMLGVVPLPGGYFMFLGGVTMTHLGVAAVVTPRLRRTLLAMGRAALLARSVTPAS